MDESEYKSTFREVNEKPCHFAKAVLSRCCGCSHARKLLLAEREAIACLSPAGHARCGILHDLLREKSLFALRLTHAEGPLPHGKEMKIQCGGLSGLRAALGGGGHDEAPVADVNALVDQALECHGTLEALPFPEVVKGVTTYQPRQRRKRR